MCDSNKSGGTGRKRRGKHGKKWVRKCVRFGSNWLAVIPVAPSMRALHFDQSMWLSRIIKWTPTSARVHLNINRLLSKDGERWLIFELSVVLTGMIWVKQSSAAVDASLASLFISVQTEYSPKWQYSFTIHNFIVAWSAVWALHSLSL